MSWVKSRRTRTICALPGILGAMLSLHASAIDMSFKGVLIDPPNCTINNGAVIDVDFGPRVGIKKINGENYRQPINYVISCEPGPGRWDMVLTLQGTAAAFDTAAIKTNVEHFGIRIYQDDQPFPVGSELKIDPLSPPVLEAVPVAKPGMILPEGEFEATATLQASYQ